MKLDVYIKVHNIVQIKEWIEKVNYINKRNYLKENYIVL